MTLFGIQINTIMKRIFVTLFVLVTVATSAQKSVLLRANYNQDNSYVITIEQQQNMGLQGGFNMSITMQMNVIDVSNTEIKTASKIETIKMDMLQAGQEFKYDSTKSDEELDAMGKALKAQFDPMMKSSILSTLNKRGKLLSIKSEPANANMDQFSNQSSIEYPEEKVSVGSIWSSEDENMGMKMKTLYTVTKIENGIVYADISGSVSGMGEGTIKGKTEIDIKTGIQKMLENEVNIKAMGQDMKVTSKIYTRKM